MRSTPSPPPPTLPGRRGPRAGLAAHRHLPPAHLLGGDGHRLFFQVLVDGWLTKLSAPIVLYAPEHFLGVRIPFDIPIEDFAFGFAMVTLTLAAVGAGRAVDDDPAPALVRRYPDPAMTVLAGVSPSCSWSPSPTWPTASSCTGRAGCCTAATTRPRLGRFEANDLFPVVFAVVTILAMAAGYRRCRAPALVAVGVGVTAYGAGLRCSCTTCTSTAASAGCPAVRRARAPAPGPRRAPPLRRRALRDAAAARALPAASCARAADVPVGPPGALPRPGRAEPALSVLDEARADGHLAPGGHPDPGREDVVAGRFDLVEDAAVEPAGGARCSGPGPAGRSARPRSADA